MRRGLVPLLAAATAGLSPTPTSTWQRGPSPTSTWQRGYDRRGAIAAAASAVVSFVSPVQRAEAFVAGSDQETSGLVVLRVAEVCNFQEKLLRTISKCSGPNAKDLLDQFGLPYCGDSGAYTVSPTQILFGTGLLLRNSNLDGNLKLMIQTEVPKKQQPSRSRSRTTSSKGRLS